MTLELSLHQVRITTSINGEEYCGAVAVDCEQFALTSRRSFVVNGAPVEIDDPIIGCEIDGKAADLEGLPDWPKRVRHVACPECGHAVPVED